LRFRFQGWGFSVEGVGFRVKIDGFSGFGV